jgi:transcriptional regulator with XRE-family HTH domain
MNAARLRKWMDQNNKTIVDIASLLRLAPGTVSNFLKGKNVHRSTLNLLSSLTKDADKPSAARRKEPVS